MVSAAGVLSFAAMLMQMGVSMIYAFPLVDRRFERSSLTTQQQPLLAMRPERETSSSTSTSLTSSTSSSPSINLPHILKTFPDARVVLPGAHPIVAIPDFLTAAECAAIQAWAIQAIANGATECDDYLNYRVNREIATTGQSRESQSLLDDYDGKGNGNRNSNSNGLDAKLSSTDSGGFRIRLEPRVVEHLLEHRVMALLNRSAATTKFLYEEGLWHRPTPRTILVRDQTVVRYTPGDGVPPHVDGKDGTLLIYLTDVPPGAGGRTVFPDHGFAQTPAQGTALFYRSKTELVHYSEAMIMSTSTGDNSNNDDTSKNIPAAAATKWILQLLLDFDHEYRPGDCVVDFRTGTSYVWNGEH